MHAVSPHTSSKFCAKTKHTSKVSTMELLFIWRDHPIMTKVPVATYCSYSYINIVMKSLYIAINHLYTTTHNLADIANIKFKVAIIQISCNIYSYSTSVDVIDPGSDCKASAYNEGW